MPTRLRNGEGRVTPAEGRTLGSGGFGRSRGSVIGEEPANTGKDPDASEEALSEGEERAGIPLLPALRQDLSRGHSCSRLRTGEGQQGRAGSGWAECRDDRVTGFGGVADRHQEQSSQQDVSTTTGAAGHDPEARGRRTSPRNPDDSGPGGTDCHQAGDRTDL